MGCCLSRKALDPNQPVDIAQPPTGLDGVQISYPRKTSAPLQESLASVSLYILKENRCKDERCGSPLQERNTNSVSSDLQKGKHGFPTNPRDLPVSMVNKDEKFIAQKLVCFCYSVLKAATHKFSDKNLIGQGGFGDVYVGFINFCTMNAAKPNAGFAIAAKRLRSKGSQGHEEWLNELRCLSRLNHPNVVKLIGYCSEGEHRILVYEFMCKGSLEAHLFGENNTKLNWSQRIKIAIGAARGLDYLHTQGTPVIHRDLKASNVLLDPDFNAKLSDFGLAKFGPLGEDSHFSTRVLGTRGYFAPEYIATGHLTRKTDVYSFGVVLLEIFSGAGAVKKYSDGAAGDLQRWAKPYLSNKLELHRVIDKRLRKCIPMEEARKFAEIILRCLSSNPKSRPTMTEVVADLELLQQNMGSCNPKSLHLHNPEETSSVGIFFRRMFRPVR